MIPLPVDRVVPDILDALGTARAVVVTAAPGAGKTTRVPPALAVDGPVILLQPRRVAARAIASRIADERGWTLGREVGWQVRFERRFTPETRLLVVTEGILTARLQGDPLVSEFHTIVFDEFHERSIHSDIAIALAKQAWQARDPSTRSGSPRASSRGDDLRIVVMSATIDARAVADFLGNCPVIDVPGQLHSVSTTYAPGQSAADAVVDLSHETYGNVLCFQPGAREIREAIDGIRRKLGDPDVDIFPLYGALDSAEQDAVLQESSRRRIVVATNIAETSLTVPGVTGVVDSGLHKVARYDADRAIDSLELERISQDSADQRAGRAGRIGPGVVRRLWDSRDRLRPHREPDIHRIDLSAALLDVISWGGDPRSLEWFERPRDTAIERAMTLLERLGLVRGGRLTAMGERVRHLPLHPRLARMLVAAGGSREMVRAVACLAERHLLPPRRAATTCDLLSAIDNWSAVPPHVQRVTRELERLLVQEGGAGQTAMTDEAFRQAVFSGYPDRIAQRREAGSSRLRLSSGTGAVMGKESGVVDGEFIVALDIHTSSQAMPRANESADQLAVVRLASLCDREWLIPNDEEVLHRFDAQSGKVKALQRERYDALVLSEHPVPVDPETAAALLAEAWQRRGPAADDVQLLRRLRFAGTSAGDLADLVRVAARGARSLADIRLVRALTPEMLKRLDRDAPATLAVPSGRTVPLEYGDEGGVAATVKLQELFGLGETPLIGPGLEPVVFALVAPNGRPVQVTRDLRSFWNRTYPEVRKELRGRYPRHPWPEDPWTATPTRRVLRKQRGVT